MTLQELCKKYNYSENTIKRSFKRTQESLKNKGLILTKIGYGDNAQFFIEEDINFKPKEKEVQLSDRLKGQKFGHLTVLRDTGKRIHRSIIWECRCDCGNLHEVSSNNLNGGRVQSCGKSDCPYHKRYDNLKGLHFGKLTALYPTSMKDGTHMYWMCQCECGNQKEVASNHLKNGNVQSCGCISSSIGELQIKEILESNNICFAEQYSFPDLKNIRPLRFDFAIFNNQNQLIRLVEFDGIQHFEEQNYFTQSLEKYQNNDKLKNDYCKQKNIPLVRIPYTEKNKITLEKIFGEEYLI